MPLRCRWAGQTKTPDIKGIPLISGVVMYSVLAVPLNGSARSCRR